MGVFGLKDNEKLHRINVYQDEMRRIFKDGLKHVDTSTSIQEIEAENYNKSAERYMRTNNCKMTV